MARSKGAGSLVRRGRYWQCKIVVDDVPDEEIKSFFEAKCAEQKEE